MNRAQVIALSLLPKSTSCSTLGKQKLPTWSELHAASQTSPNTFACARERIDIVHRIYTNLSSCEASFLATTRCPKPLAFKFNFLLVLYNSALTNSLLYSNEPPTTSHVMLAKHFQTRPARSLALYLSFGFRFECSLSLVLTRGREREHLKW